MYGITFSKTVRTFPKTIFLVACGALVIAFVLISCVRLPDTEHELDDVEEQQPLVFGEDDEDPPRLGREDTLVGVPEPLIVVDDADGAGAKVVKP